jgi:hypothetical protein
LGTALGKGISAGADINTLKAKGLSTKDFDAQRRNILFGTTATGGSNSGVDIDALLAGKTPEQQILILKALAKK